MVEGNAAAVRPQRTAWARSLGAPVRDFLGTETGAAAVLALAVVAALTWANSPWSETYRSLWHTKLALSVGSHTLSADLRTWVNEGLMSVFFLVVGLEATRELALGELRERRRAAIPALAAGGGMAAAAAIFVAVNAGGSGAHGWGVALSTDTALALGALSLAAPRGATRLRVFLLTLVVVDDLGGLAVIAFLYTDRISAVALAVALALFGVLILLRFLERGRGPLAVMVGIGIWLAMFESGIDPVIVGLAIGLVTSAYPPPRQELERAIELTRSFREQPTPELAQSAQRGLAAAISPNELLLHRLHPWSGFVIVPLFALANMGVHIDAGLLGEAIASPVTLGIVAAYVLGKPAGILAASWLGARGGLGGGRLTITWPGLLGAGAAAGAGFTVSLLVARRAFSEHLLAQAQLGLLAAVIVSLLFCFAVFWSIRRLPAHVRARQLGRTAARLVDLADDVDPARDHIRGGLQAPVTLLEYADFECPYCGRAEPMVRELLAERGAQLRYVFRHLPLAEVHPWAELAAEAVEAAGAQGAFWEMHDLLFAHEGELAPRDIRAYARQLGLDTARMERELRERVHEQRVASDVAGADASGVSGTPSFFLNGRRLRGPYSLESLRAAVGRAAAAAAAAEAIAA